MWKEGKQEGVCDKAQHCPPFWGVASDIFSRSVHPPSFDANLLIEGKGVR